jgi:hypothetical protein
MGIIHNDSVLFRKNNGFVRLNEERGDGYRQQLSFVLQELIMAYSNLFKFLFSLFLEKKCMAFRFITDIFCCATLFLSPLIHTDPWDGWVRVDSLRKWLSYILTLGWLEEAQCRFTYKEVTIHTDPWDG